MVVVINTWGHVRRILVIRTKDVITRDTKYLLDLGVNGMGQSNRTLPVVWSEVRQTGHLNSKSRAGAPFTIGEAYLKIIMSSFLGFVNVILETGGVMFGQVCPDVTRNYGALGQTARVCFGVGQVCPDVDKELWRLGPDWTGVFGVLCANKKKEEETKRPEKEKKRGGDPKGEVEEKRSEKTRAGRLRKRRGESQSLIRVAVQESKTRMRKNALWTGPRDKLRRERFQNGDIIPVLGTETINFTI
ncbi:hypothetical protein TNCV_3774401 [Trichonephila clavipes]|nr:hypothetical protein TNCV_3774401 [Trichonephila clavipes]